MQNRLTCHGKQHFINRETASKGTGFKTGGNNGGSGGGGGGWSGGGGGDKWGGGGDKWGGGGDKWSGGGGDKLIDNDGGGYKPY